jgi:uncharacterized protein YdcH (DUF465 family)
MKGMDSEFDELLAQSEPLDNSFADLQQSRRVSKDVNDISFYT